MKLLKAIMGIPSPSGREEKMIDFIAAFAAEQKLAFFTDVMGNVFLSKKEKPHAKRAVVVPMDEPSVMITSYTKEGKAHLAPIGGLSPNILKRARVQTGELVGVIVGGEGKNEEDLQITDLCADFGFSSEEEAKEKISAGTILSLERNLIFLQNDDIVGRFCGRKAMIADVLETIGEGSLSENVVVIFTVQKEMNARGAKVAAAKTEAEEILLLGTDGEAKSSEGAALRFADKGAIYDAPLREELLKTAENQNISVQQFFGKSRNPESGMFQLSDGGKKIVLLTLPVCLEKEENERVAKTDRKALEALLKSYMMEEKV